MSFLGSLFNVGKSLVKSVGSIAIKGSPLGIGLGIAGQVQRLVSGGAGVTRPFITARATFGSFGDGLTQPQADTVGMRLADIATIPVITAPAPPEFVAPYLYAPPGQTGVGSGPVNTIQAPLVMSFRERGSSCSKSARRRRRSTGAVPKAKKRRKAAKKTTARRKGRKLKFGSPAWRKKYNLGKKRRRRAA